MSSAPFFKCYPSDFLAGIAGLKAEEIAVYTVALMLIYDRGGPVVADYEHIGWRCQMRPSSAKKLVERLIERGKLGLLDGRLTNNRAEIELSFRRDLAEISRRNGKRNVAKVDPAVNENKDLANPAGSRQEPVTRSQRPEARTIERADAPVSAPAPAPAPAPAREAAPARPDMPERMHPRLLAALPEGVNWPVVTAVNLRPILECLNAGADFERHVLPTVAAYGRSIRGAGKKIYGWEEVARQIHAAVERERAPATAAPVETVPDELWNRAVAHYRRSGEWMLQNRSTPPDRPNTRVPAAILAEHGYGPPPASPEITAA